MSAFGSSVINKSNKRLAPKAPAHRRHVAPTTQAAQEGQAINPSQPRFERSAGYDSLQSDSDGAPRPDSAPIFTNSRHTRAATIAANQHTAQSTIVADGLEHVPDHPKKRRKTGEVFPVSELHLTHSQVDSNAESSEQPNISGLSRTHDTAESVVFNESSIVRSSAAEHLTTDTQPVADPEDTATSSHVLSQADVAGSMKKNKKQLAGPSRHRPGRLRRKVQIDEIRHGEGDAVDSGNQPVMENHEASNNSHAPARELRRRRQTTRDAATNTVANQAEDTVIGRAARQSTSVGERYNSNGEEEQELVPRRKRRKRVAPPDDTEEHQIDPSALKMYDLCRDSGIGKSSTLESEFQGVNWIEVLRRRKETVARARAGETTLETGANEAGGVAADRSLETAPQGPQLKLVNGQIVVDTSSLVVDRHAAARPDDAQLAVEEQDITRRINSQSWVNENRKDPEDRYPSSTKSDRWSAESTEKFYSSLRMFGTDFMMISKMFPGRTRRHIKLKFVREERADPARIQEALVGGGIPMNLQTHCDAAGRRTEDYKDPADLEKELKAEEDRQRAAIEKQKEEQAEAQRKKQEAAAAKTASVRQRRAGEKGAAKSRRKKQDGSAPNHATGSRGASPANDGVVESIELQSSVAMVG